MYLDFKKTYDLVRGEVLYNIVIEYGILVKLIWLIKMCLNETCSKVCIETHLTGMFRMKNDLREGDALSPLIFNFAVEFAIGRVQVNQEGLKLSGTLQLLVYVDDVNIE
jgi:hypothetical protein